MNIDDSLDKILSNGGLLDLSDIRFLAEFDEFCPIVLVCGTGEVIVNAREAEHFISVLDRSGDIGNDESDFVQEMFVPLDYPLLEDWDGDEDEEYDDDDEDYGPTNEFELVEIDGEMCEIDKEMVGFIKFLNDIPGIHTKFCCQGEIKTKDTDLDSWVYRTYLIFTADDIASAERVLQILDNYCYIDIYKNNNKINVCVDVHMGYLRFDVRWLDLKEFRKFKKKIGVK